MISLAHRIRRFVVGPSDAPPLARLRRMYFALVAAALLLLPPQLVFAQSAPSLRAAALIAIAVLFVTWLRAARHGRTDWWTEAVDVAGFLAVALALGDMNRALTVYFTSIFLHAFSSGARRMAFTTIVYVAILLVGMQLTSGVGPQVVSMVPNIVMIAIIASVLRASLERRADLERQLHASESRFRTLVQNSSDVIMIVDEDGVVRYHTPSAQRLLGAMDLMGSRISSILHPDDAAGAATFLRDIAMAENSTAGWRLLHRDGMWLHVEVVSSGVLHDSAIGGLVLTMRNVTERKALELRLVHQAMHDALTDLPNRSLLRESVDEAIAAARLDEHALAVLFIDLDDFKTVNDTLGHLAGDQLIVAVAKRLRDCLRPSDLAARLGGDEFALLLPRLRAVEDAEIVARRIVVALQEPFRLAGQDVSIHASIGIATSLGGECSTEELLRSADVAMYVAKAHGKGRYEFFSKGMAANFERRRSLEGEMQVGLERGEFIAHYQPVVRLDSERMIGVEALVRWSHPTRGLLSPAEFLDQAEDSGLIVPIGRAILREACQRTQAWNAPRPSGTQIGVSVNMSARQLLDPSVLADVAAALEASGLEPGLLWIEVTETVLRHDAAAVQKRLSELRSLGVRVTLDDFGGGYTSLEYLRRFPLDGIKIDRSFIGDIDTDQGGAQFARAIVHLGQALGLSAVAEGIERPEQARIMREAGCFLGQGYLFARPLPPTEVEALLSAESPAADRTTERGELVVAVG